MYPEATFHGYVGSTQDVLLIFEACRRGMLPKIHRRLQEKERGLIQSGAIFVFDEHDSGIKRWTDGYNWSPSRILGNFLIYREVYKKPSSRKVSSASITDVRDDITDYTPVKKISKRKGERRLVGSLSESYGYKDDGLIKKSMSIKINGISQHLISYYYPEEVKNGQLRSPSSVPELAELEISSDLLQEENFRVPPMVEPSVDQHHLAMMPSTPPYMTKPSYMMEEMPHQGYPLEPQQRPHHLPSQQYHQHPDSDQRSLPPFRSMSLGYIYPEPNAIHPPYPTEPSPSFSSNTSRFQEENKRHIKSEYDHFTLPNIFPPAPVHPYLPSPHTIPGTVDHF
ncbi:hypothetical protein INT44_009051 [Umbelopsis vinacea]|uniref:Uncharacterized protein n=1 Tax=Umbelopsis vinacea TaxID=44442 RepID=A0A8H7UI80_9FUNG|nr:hypothetical protein INT44_009051 [Umbelopsis vinacea]